MNYNFKEYEIDKSTFIGGWHTDHEIIDNMWDYFFENKEYATPGKVYRDGDTRISKEDKDSLDLTFAPDSKYKPVSIYLDMLNQVLQNYIKKGPKVNNYARFGVNSYPNIQYYVPGGGYKPWHWERGFPAVADRVLVFTTYLNDVEDGGTEFLYQDLILPAKKGLTVIFPTDFTHTHRGVISQKEKMIITGWFNFL